MTCLCKPGCCARSVRVVAPCANEYLRQISDYCPQAGLLPLADLMLEGRFRTTGETTAIGIRTASGSERPADGCQPCRPLRLKCGCTVRDSAVRQEVRDEALSIGAFNPDMARGWDSKAIEDQIAEAEAAKASREKPVVLPDERESVARLGSLELSRVNVLNRLEATRNERYRVQLRAALDHLDNEIRELNETAAR